MVTWGRLVHGVQTFANVTGPSGEMNYKREGNPLMKKSADRSSQFLREAGTIFLGIPEVTGIDGIEINFPGPTPMPSALCVARKGGVRRRRAV